MSTKDASDLLVSRGHLITHTTGEAAIYGLSFTLYILCARSLYLQLQDRDQRKQRLFTLLYTSLLMALALCNLAVDSQIALSSYVDHADYPGGAYAYSREVLPSSSIDIVGYAAIILINLMTFGIQIWRLYIVWIASPFSYIIAIVPALALLTEIAFEVATVVKVAGSGLTDYLVNLFFFSETALSFCIPVIVTLLIISRIFMVRRRNIKLMGRTDSSRPFTSLIAMLIESFALESVWMLCILGTSFTTSDPLTEAVNVFLVDARPFIQVLAYLLLVHRVTTGRGWKENTEAKLTTLRWNRDGLQTTQGDTQTSTTISQAQV